jgi:crossover junction endodeoxyribonuclease RuvC
MSTVLGLDPSMTSTGLAVLWTIAGQARMTTRAIPSAPAPIAERTVNLRARRLGDIVRDIETTVMFHRPALAVVESPVPNRRMKSGMLLERGAVYWNALDMLDRYGVEIVECAPRQRALYATGDGAADKVSVARHTLNEHGLIFDTDDELDAYVLAKIGRRLIGRPVDEDTEHRLNVADALSAQLRERS